MNKSIKVVALSIMLVLMSGCGASSEDSGDQIDQSVLDADGDISVLYSSSLDSYIDSVAIIDDGDIRISTQIDDYGTDIWITHYYSNTHESFSIDYDENGIIQYLSFYPSYETDIEQFFLSYDSTGNYVDYISFNGETHI